MQVYQEESAYLAAVIKAQCLKQCIREQEGIAEECLECLSSRMESASE
jgi:hypothetical protein